MPLADCSVRGALKREGVSLRFLAAHRGVEAKLGLVSLTSIPPYPCGPAAPQPRNPAEGPGRLGLTDSDTSVELLHLLPE